jgi:acyl-[acyl-carrier-protein]-phospholipid O-acyltransferase/long-chain-fatty-acid--[acyl-carrier-protein] ligase
MSLGAFNDNFIKQALITLLAFGSLGLTTSQMTIYNSLAFGLMILPFFLFSSLAGEIADSYRKSKLMKYYKAIELFLMCIAGAFFYLENYLGLIVVLFFMGTQSAFFGPVKYSLLPEVLAEKDLVTGNGLVEGFTFIAIVLGTLLGTFLITTTYGPKLIVPIGIFIVALGGLLMALKQPASKILAPNLKIDPLIVRSTWQILKEARGKSDIWKAILSISWFWAMGSVVLAQTPVLVQRFGGTPGVNTFMISMFAVGVAIGSISVQFFLKGKVSAHLVPLSALFLSVFLTLFTICVANIQARPASAVTLAEFLSSWEFLPLAITSLLVSITAGFFVVPLNALIQHRAPLEKRSRVIAANNIMNSLFIVLASLLVLVLTTLGFPLSDIFVYLTISAFLVMLLTLYFLPDEVIRQIARLIIFLLYRPEISGQKNFELHSGPLLIVPNHTSFLDVALLVCYSPRRLSFAIDSNWAKAWWVKPFLRFFTCIPINPSQPLAARDLVAALKSGQTLVIFPEGRITVTGNLMKVHEGPGTVASLAQVPVMPVVIDGAEYTFFGRMKDVLHNMPKKFQVKMRFFPPLFLDQKLKPGESRRAFRQRLAAELYEIMLQVRVKTRPFRMNIFEALQEASKKYGSSRMIIEDVSRNPISYGDILLKARILGRLLKKSLEAKGNYVGVLLPNSSIMAISLFALWAAGKVPVVLNYTHGEASLQAALKAARVDTIVSSHKFLDQGKLRNLCEKLPVEIICLEDLKIGTFAKLAGLMWTPVLQPSDSPAAVLFTSGSEGKPKGAALSHQGILANIHQAKCLVEINEDDIMFNAMPAFHALGLNIGMLLPLVLGLRSFNYVSPLHVNTIPELIYDTKSTVVLGSDNFVSAWAKNAAPYDFFSVKFMILGAEKVRKSTAELLFHKMSVRLFEGYGVTEAGPVLAVNSKIRVRDGSVGQFLPGIRFKLEKVDGIEAGAKLLVKGHNIMMGYLSVDNPGVIEPPLDGWHDTGDIVEVDEDGFVWIKGRFKRFAKLSGEMVSLSSVEEAANKLWPGRPLAVLAVPDEEKGEKLLLVTSGQSPDMTALRNAVRNYGLSEISVPKAYMLIPEIPLTTMGKVNIPKLTEEVFAQMG